MWVPQLYQSLTDAHANVDSENETLTPRSGGRGALALAHESKTFTLGRMLWAYALSMALQVGDTIVCQHVLVPNHESKITATAKYDGLLTSVPAWNAPGHHLLYAVAIDCPR